MGKVFRKVDCKERLPEKEGFYYTTLGVSHFNKTWTDDFMNEVSPLYWLEEVPEPTDEEMDVQAANKCEDNCFDYTNGAKWMRDKLFNT